MFPYYLSIGMTYEQYWNEDCTLARMYYEAEHLKRNRRNAEMWMQGSYIYEALVAVSPIFNAFSDKHEPFPYREEPYMFSDDAEAQERIERANEKKLNNGLEYMQNLSKLFNTQLRKEVEQNE